jgi:hypothetical protein
MSKLTTKCSDFWQFIKNGPINTVSLIPPLIACLLIAVWGLAKEWLFPVMPQLYNYAILSIATILAGSVGLIYIYRKEMPGPVSSSTVKGGWAVVTGFVLLLFFWSLGIAAFVFSLLE